MVFCKRLPVGNPSGGNKNADPHGSIGSPAKKNVSLFLSRRPFVSGPDDLRPEKKSHLSSGLVETRDTF